MKEIFQLDGIPKIVISNIDTKFTGNFWKASFKGLDT
jgi:ribosomal protein S5